MGRETRPGTLKRLLREAEEDLRQWVELAQRQRNELPVADLPAMPSVSGMQDTDDLRLRIRLELER